MAKPFYLTMFALVTAYVVSAAGQPANEPVREPTVNPVREPAVDLVGEPGPVSTSPPQSVPALAPSVWSETTKAPQRPNENQGTTSPKFQTDFRSLKMIEADKTEKDCDCADELVKQPDDCIDMVNDPKGKKYKGGATTSENGHTCQRWDSQEPNQHNTPEDRFPDENKTAAENFCRNPNGDEFPWCFVTDADVGKDYCDIPECPDECLSDPTGKYYAGRTSETESGRKCQPWALLRPHSHILGQYYSYFPEKDIIKAKDFCRNPDRSPKPWCFTMDPDKRWEYCNIKQCPTGTTRIIGAATTVLREPTDAPMETTVTSKPPGCITPEGAYDGSVSTTVSGFTCQRWDSQQPHKHIYANHPNFFPGKTISENENYCRNPFPKYSETAWCHTTDRWLLWEFCNVTECEPPKKPKPGPECKKTADGLDYKGVQSKTKSGKSCQLWLANYPHAKNLHKMYNNFPEKSLKLAENYCRNPDKSSTGPWCYTMDSTTEKETCGIPDCPECKETKKGLKYMGETEYSFSGMRCKKWSTRNFDGDNFPEGDVADAKNYCRNPDGKDEGPWCFIGQTDDDWEYCFVPYCNPPMPPVPGRECYEDNGKSYTGSSMETRTGKWCQSWMEQVPHRHGYSNANDFPDESLYDASNYCRNPDNSEDGPWCFTTESDVRKEFCDVPECKDCKDNLKGHDYIGNKTETVSGFTCDFWINHAITVDSSKFPYEDLDAAKNYCRNPTDQPEGPWCYVNHQTLVWEYCLVKLCKKPDEPTDECKTDEQGSDYEGPVNEGKIGGKKVECQMWIAQHPNRHSRRGDRFPEGSLFLAKDYCRNPDNDPKGPWCYSLDAPYGKAHCDIETCPTTPVTTEKTVTEVTTPPPVDCAAYMEADYALVRQRSNRGKKKNLQCVFPFTYRGKQYHSCILHFSKKPWCAVTADYDMDRLWKYCSDYTLTIHGGSDPTASKCRLPFMYLNTEYKVCLSYHGEEPWCGTTYNFDVDKKWAYCKATRSDTVR
ncbi:apolipoprotein(a)-like isoform X2 [Tubulanus polymorphus]|uniref:apolipoprotein(a)-like isoform X2 n=1 Tax=Tubulanus polymorphus TaxID=672921 RepID=UPI003DA37F46